MNKTVIDLGLVLHMMKKGNLFSLIELPDGIKLKCNGCGELCIPFGRAQAILMPSDNTIEGIGIKVQCPICKVPMDVDVVKE